MTDTTLWHLVPFLPSFLPSIYSYLAHYGELQTILSLELSCKLFQRCYRNHPTVYEHVRVMKSLFQLVRLTLSSGPNQGTIDMPVMKFNYKGRQTTLFGRIRQWAPRPIHITFDVCFLPSQDSHMNSKSSCQQMTICDLYELMNIISFITGKKSSGMVQSDFADPYVVPILYEMAGMGNDWKYAETFFSMEIQAQYEDNYRGTALLGWCGDSSIPSLSLTSTSLYQ